MAKVKFWVDSGANINSMRKSKVLDTVADLGLLPGEWESMLEEDRYTLVEEWAYELISMGWTEEQ